MRIFMGSYMELANPSKCTSYYLKRSEIKMGYQGQCSVSADGNVILIITIQVANINSH